MIDFIMSITKKLIIGTTIIIGLFGVWWWRSNYAIRTIILNELNVSIAVPNKLYLYVQGNPTRLGEYNADLRTPYYVEIKLGECVENPMIERCTIEQMVQHEENRLQKVVYNLRTVNDFVNIDLNNSCKSSYQEYVDATPLQWAYIIVLGAQCKKTSLLISGWATGKRDYEFIKGQVINIAKSLQELK